MNVDFLSPLCVRIDSDEQATLIEDFVVEIDEVAMPVPAGFVTDWSSVPRLPVIYALFGGRAKKAAVVHDYLYQTGAEREYADSVFLAAMREQHLPAWRRALMWAAVRLGGWAFYLHPAEPGAFEHRETGTGQ